MSLPALRSNSWVGFSGSVELVLRCEPLRCGFCSLVVGDFSVDENSSRQLFWLLVLHVRRGTTVGHTASSIFAARTQLKRKRMHRLMPKRCIAERCRPPN